MSTPTHTPALRPHADAASQRLAEWLGAAAQGDRRAFRALHDATCARLLVQAMQVLRQREAAEDVLQEAYVKVWRCAAQYDPGLAQPMTWLLRLVRNTAIDRLRAGRVEARLTESMDIALADQVACPAPGPEQDCHQAGLQRRLEQALRTLGRTERQAVARVLYRGLSATEAAEQGVTSAAQARPPLRRAVQQLRRCFDPVGVAWAAL
jgi:RNA polymerase sigma-70 factor, ECF subfamily